MQSFNIIFQPFFEWLSRSTIQASMLICLILLVQMTLRSRLGVRTCHALWLILLLRMVIPWTPQSRLSIFNLMPQAVQHNKVENLTDKLADESFRSAVTNAGTPDTSPASTTAVPQETPKPARDSSSVNRDPSDDRQTTSRHWRILHLVWLAGAAVLAVYVCANNFILLRIIRRERPLTDQKILDLLEDCKTEMGVRTILGVVSTDKVKSASLFGFIRPRLLLPRELIESLSRQELRYVFLHELAHLKRHDIYLGWLTSILQVLHWFNPFVWLAFYKMRVDRELACDALVLARLTSGGLARTRPDESKNYGRTIVSLLERFSQPRRLPAMAGILETKTQLKRRITMIARFKKNSYQWSPLGVILIIILGCVSLPDAIRAKASGISAAEPETVSEAASQPTPVDPGSGGLVAYYAMENDANDSSGNGNDGTIFGDPVFVDGPPGYGRAMEFDGDDYVDCGNTENLARWTIACWAKSPAAPSRDSPSGPVHREKNYQLNWNHHTEEFRGAAALRVGGSLQWHAAKYGPLEADTWYHLAATYDGEDLKAYRDGELITTNDAPSGPPDAEPRSLKLARHAVSAQYFTGTVDEVIIYNRALSVGEIRYLAGFRAPVALGMEGLVAYYAMENDVLDGSGNGNDGTVVGDPVFVDGPPGYGRAMDFDGIDDYVSTPFVLNPADAEFSVFAWVKGGAAGQVLISQADGANWLSADPSYGKLMTGLRPPAGRIVPPPLASEFVITDGNWHRVGFVWDGSQRILYVDDLEVARDTQSSLQGSAAGLYIGAGKALEAGSFFSGLIDDVRIYNRAVSP